jgi:4'-phosphopantetheinyl transferase EntD
MIEAHVQRLSLGAEAASVALALARPREADDKLTPEEALIAREFRAARRATFSTGRSLARNAMAEIGVPAASVLRAPDGGPVWPPGCLGSISHSRDWVAAVAAQNQAYRGLGVDIEQRSRVREHLFRRILTARELHALNKLAEAERPERATWIFSAKEAVYKAVYPTLRRYIGFAAVEVQMTRSLDAGEFRVGAGALSGRPTVRELGRVSFRHVGEDAECGLIDAAIGRLMAWHDQVIALVVLPGVEDAPRVLREGQWSGSL